MTVAVATHEWVGPEASIVVAGAVLTGVYVGAATTPEIIDPDLVVDLSAPDWRATTVERLHYGELTPQARAAFLVWHRTGRRAPEAPSCWALLHLYALERRVLVDGDRDEALRDEARRLGETYGADPEVVRVARALAGDYPRARPPSRTHGGVPDELRVELGRRALTSDPVTAEWALAWAWFHPELPRREARTQTPEEFARLWTIRFADRLPDGLLVSPKRRRLTLDHSPANPSLPSPLELTVADASDVFLTAGPTATLREITDQVEEELAALARWRTRFPDESVDSIRAATVLPEALFSGSPSAEAARALVEQAESALADSTTATTDSEPLLDAWREATGQREVERRDAVELAQVLERFGIGLEPDVRFGGRPLTRRSPIVLFRQVGVPTTSPSEAYAAALVTLELCAAVAFADGTVDDAEQAMLVERVQRAEGLAESDRARLDAHRVLVTTSRLGLDDVARRVVGLPVAQRHALATHLLDLARVDGVVTDDEVRELRRVHELLGINPSEVDNRLRPRTVVLTPRPTPPAGEARPVGERAERPEVEPTFSDETSAASEGEPPVADRSAAAPATDTGGEDASPDGDVAVTSEPQPVPIGPKPSATGPVTDQDLIEPRGPSDPDPIPRGSTGSSPSIRLVRVDEDALRRVQADNRAVQAALAQIFDTDDEADEPEEEPAVAGIASLDSAHSALLRDLAERPRTSRRELELASAAHGVLPDGALDVINEVALDLTEDLVVEVDDDESVTIDHDVYEEMCA